MFKDTLFISYGRPDLDKSTAVLKNHVNRACDPVWMEKRSCGQTTKKVETGGVILRRRFMAVEIKTRKTKDETEVLVWNERCGNQNDLHCSV